MNAGINLVRSEACYQFFEGSLYGLVCFYNKCTLIKGNIQSLDWTGVDYWKLNFSTIQSVLGFACVNM